MEPPHKRQRLSLTRTSESTNDIDLQIARARNDRKLKSLFEGIFEKYGKDFSEIGDEIDLRTGEIVVNKGHVQRMEQEDDTGELTEVESEDEKMLHDDHDAAGDFDTTFTFQNAKEGLFDGNEGLEAGTESVATTPSHGTRVRNIITNNLHSPTASKPTDPKWKAPEIDAKFWTPPRKEISIEVHETPRTERPKSPPTATSVWAVRTPGRPRGSTSKKQNVSGSKKTPTMRTKRKRKTPVKLDWSFARVQGDDSDSDDPLQDDSLPSSIRSNRVMGRNSVSITPKALNVISNNVVDISRKRDHKAGEVETIRAPERIEASRPMPDTPEVLSSSPVITNDTPTHRRYPVNFDSPSIIKPEEVILTPDEVKVIVRFKCESVTGLCMEDIGEHLPGRTLDDLLNWADHHSLLFLSNGSVPTVGWSAEDLEKLDEFADESGIWWRDIQMVFPHRSRREIEKQMIRIWTERIMDEQREKNEEEEEPIDSPTTNRNHSQTPCSSDNDPALRTSDVRSNDDLVERLEEESDNDGPSLSAIGVGPRKAVFDSSPCMSPKKASPNKGLPRKTSASPRKYY